MAMAAAAAAACASAAGSSGARTAADTAPAERAPNPPSVSTAMTLRGTFTSVLQSTGAVAPAAKIRVDGSVTVISTGVGNANTRVRLTATFPLTNEQLPWAIAPGNCGNGAIAVTAVSKFGTIDVGSGGRGTLEIDLAIALDPGERYHVEVYRSGQSLADVVACANLRKVD